MLYYVLRRRIICVVNDPCAVWQQRSLQPVVYFQIALYEKGGVLRRGNARPADRGPGVFEVSDGKKQAELIGPRCSGGAPNAETQSG